LFADVLKWAGESEACELTIEPGQKIAAMGDSLTESGGYLRLIEAVFDQQYPELGVGRIINAGISGQKAEDMVERFHRDIVAQQPTIATIHVGINDVWHRLEEPHDAEVLEAYGRNVERMVQMATVSGIRVYLLSPTVIEEDANSEGNRRLAGYVAAGRAIARQNSCEYVDLHQLFLDAVERKGDAAGPFTRDGVHMNPIGNALMAVGILRAWGVPDEKMMNTDVSSVSAGG
jgi:lysophospholipase L1-like esterase